MRFISFVAVATTFTFLALQVPSPALALAVPKSDLAPFHSSDSRIRRTYSDSAAIRHRIKHSVNMGHNITEVHRTGTIRQPETQIARRDVLGNLLTTFSPSYGQILSSSQLLSGNAAVASTQGDDQAFRQQTSDSLSQFHQGLLSFNILLGQLSADKGLANYDKGDKLETVLKNVVNATKNALSAIDVLVYRIPLLGSVLGSLVYQIKCIIDDLLNATENVTDALLNGLAPLLRNLDNQVVSLLCGPLLASSQSLNVAGICVNV